MNKIKQINLIGVLVIAYIIYVFIHYCVHLNNPVKYKIQTNTINVKGKIYMPKDTIYNENRNIETIIYR